MVALTLANLLGAPGYGTQFDLDGALELMKKSTGGGTAIARGRIFFVTDSTGISAIATGGSTGRMGVVPKLYPQMTDSDANFFGVTRSGAETYVEAAGVIHPNARIMPTTGGKAIEATGTPTMETAPFAYMGHYGEGRGLGNPITNSANGEPIRVRHL